LLKIRQKQKGELARKTYDRERNIDEYILNLYNIISQTFTG